MRALFEGGRLAEAIDALGAEVRSDPMDVRKRTFLFELLCFAGEYDRAGKQLDVVAGSSKEAELGAWLYRSALHAERTRQEMFATGAFPVAGASAPRPVSGTLNGERFARLTDADPRIGARLEVFVAGEYTWIPLEHLAGIRMEPPSRLRDLLWAPARVAPGSAFQELELGEVIIPALAPLSWRHADGAVKLGRVTVWEDLQNGAAAPLGQKLMLVDGEEFPILEIRELHVDPPAAER